MKINLNAKWKERALNAVRSASLSSRILFILCLFSGTVWILSNFEEVMLIVMGLCGVLWLSSIAMHAFRRGTMGGRNPFTVLIVLCAAVSFVCLGTARLWTPEYNQQHEPINLTMESYRRILNDSTEEELAEQGSFTFSFSHMLNNTNANLLAVDADGRVLARENQWIIGNNETVRALICPASYGSEQGLMILTDGKGNVLGAFLINMNYAGNTATNEYSYNPLTIPDAADTDPDGNAKDARDPLYEKYFPSFGPAIDREAINLVYWDMRVGEGLYQSYENTNIFEWNGENVIELIGSSDASLVRELNSLTAAERKKLQEYLTWLRQALNTARNVNENYNSFFARILTRDDGATSLIMLFEYDQETLYPLKQKFMKQTALRENIYNAGVLMIPAIIVFLAFWVFVDAKKRGQGAPALWAVLTLIGNAVAWIIYMLVRPQMTTGVSGEMMPKGSCPICGTKLKSDYIACPGCGILLRNRCKNCGRALENDWSFCPYCTTAVVKELPESADASAEDAGAVSADA